MNFTSINERLCLLRLKGRFFKYSVINIHAPTNDSDDEAKELFSTCSENDDVKIVMEDANAKIGREIIHHPTIGKYSLHETTNENLRLVDFAAGRQMAIRSTIFMHERIHLQT
jgi:hypothetical protein